MRLIEVVETSKRIGATSRRNEKIDLLAGLLRRLDPREAPVVVRFLSGAPRQGRIGIGYRTLHAAAAEPALQPSLDVLDVDRALEEYTTIQGAGSEARRRALLGSLLARATGEEQSFLIGLLGGELRQGALEGIMAEAVARAAGLDGARVRRAAMLAGDLAAVAISALERGEEGLAQYDIELFRPVQPMLAGSAEDAAEALGALGEAALEFKFDGARIQAHKSGGEVRIYSRRLNDVTAAIPEVVEAVRALPARELILDGEVLALAPDGRPHPFQVTMRRFGRRLDVDRMRAELPVTPFWFDALYLDGGAVIDEPQRRRFEALRRIVPEQNLAPHRVTSDPEAADGFLRAALERGHEGMMAKALDAPYTAGARGQSWLKVKQARTLDLVILAAEWGNGRRQGWLSNLHLGARDTRRGGFAMLGKTFKGLTDEMLAWQTAELLKIEIARDRHTVFVEPKIVVEVAFNEIQISPRYPSGLALRFARVKRYRTDKSAAEADTFETVERLAGITSS